MNKLTNLQRLGVLQALYNQLGRQLSTKGADNTNLRHLVDRELKGYNSATGAKTFDINLGEGDTVTKIGTASVKVSKAEERDVLEVVDGQLFGAWLAEDGMEYVDRIISAHMRELLSLIEANGEVPAGCEYVHHSIPPVVTGTVVRVDPQNVAKAVERGAITGLQLADAWGVAPLLIEGEVDG